MNKSFAIGAALGAIVVTAGGATAGYKMIVASRGAEVLSVTPMTKSVKSPRQECHDEQVTRTKPVKDQNRLVGTGIGAVVGGLLGNQVGGGNGRVLATVAGAAAGGYGGNKIQQKMQQGDIYTANEQRCDTVYDIREQPAGYEVVYMLNGTQHRVHMDHDNPGKRIPVKDGRVVVESGERTGDQSSQSS